MKMIQYNRTQIVLREARGYKQVCAESISHIVCEDYICTIYLLSEKEVNSSKSLSYFEELLTPLFFFRINRNALINLKQIDKVVCRGRQRKVVMKEGVSVHIAIRRWPAFRKAFQEGSLTSDYGSFAVENGAFTG